MGLFCNSFLFVQESIESPFNHPDVRKRAGTTLAGKCEALTGALDRDVVKLSHATLATVWTFLFDDPFLQNFIRTVLFIDCS